MNQKLKQLIYNLKCWQLNPKICPKDFIDFWFNSVRLLNHVKATLSKPFTRGMKSVLSSRIGPMPLLCQCPHLLCDCFRAAKVSDLSGQPGYPHFMVGRMQKQTNKTNRKKEKNQIDSHGYIDNLWTRRVILYCPQHPQQRWCMLINLHQHFGSCRGHVPFYILHGFHGSLP